MDCQSSFYSFAGMIDEQAALRALGVQLRTMRKARGLTQEGLAALCDFNSTYVSQLERGLRNPPYLTLCLLAEQLGATVRDLLPAAE